MRIVSFLLLCCITSFSSIGQSLFQNNGGTLSERWLIHNDSTKLFKIIPYKPVYILFANYTTAINNLPVSDNPLNSVTTATKFSNTELKFQLSFKSRAVKNLFGDKIGGDLWIGYTQSSRWQLYSANISRPFRETNYEPELMLIFHTPYKLFGFEGVLSGIGINHESNGRSNPFSRSWNRVILQFGWERPSWSIIVRPWWRLPEDPIEDNNPGIEDYVGRAELLSMFSKGRHTMRLLAKHSLRTGNRNRGSVRLDYAFQLLDNLQLQAQVFHGYGENLIDFNHKQTTFGLGISLLHW
ncbi:phospholipase A [uncultured Dokdonia sp.]|uniref:phospholipase A n=1 Tax=uncultured Dokdonia sp. TaxID=575653 RepID=UPI0026070320|nr:phospholipase A [uncultured Dokdonia sp.]